MPKLKPETLEARKEHLLRSALTCFAENGYSRTTMDEIVSVSGVSKGGLYTHYESKKALYLALLEKLLVDTGLVSVLGSEEAVGRAKLTSAMSGMMAFTSSEAYQAYAALLMDAWAQSQVDEDVRETLVSNYAQLRALFTTSIEESVAAGEFKPVQADTLANVFVALFDGLMVQFMLDPGAVDWRSAASTVQTSWMDGLLAE